MLSRHVKSRIVKIALTCLVSLAFACPSFAAVTLSASHSMGPYGGYLLDATLTSCTNIPVPSGYSGSWLAYDFGVNQLVGSALLYSSSTATGNGSDFPRTVIVQSTMSPVLTTSDGNSASWTDLTTVSGVSVGPTTPVMFGFGQVITARAIRFYFPEPALYTNLSFGHVSVTSFSANIDTPVTADTYNQIDNIERNMVTKASFSNYSTKWAAHDAKGGGIDPNLVYLVMGTILACVVAVTWKG